MEVLFYVVEDCKGTISLVGCISYLTYLIGSEAEYVLPWDLGGLQYSVP